MARLMSCGFELNSTTAGVEYTANLTAAPTIQATTVNPGGSKYAAQITSLTSGQKKGINLQWTSGASANTLFIRFGLYITAYPNATTTILRVASTTPQTVATLTLGTSGIIALLNSTPATVGSSSALALNAWNYVEIWYDASPATGSRILKARINQAAEFATLTTGTTTSVLSGAAFMDIGGNVLVETATSGTWYIDDIAINDATGSFQTTYPGAGSIMHLLPASNGDINTFATQTGGTAGSSFNYTRVNEVPPDDATTLNGSNTINQEDLFRCQPIQFSGSVNVVHVGIRFRNNIADAATALKAELLGVSGGTKTQSAAIIPNSTTWATNVLASSTLIIYPITVYQDPSSANWTQQTLNTMQIGYICSTGGTNRVEFTSVWALVEVTDAIKLKLPTILNNYQQFTVGSGMSTTEKLR